MTTPAPIIDTSFRTLPHVGYPTGASGVRGVTLHRRTGKWQAQVKVNGMNRYLGLHATIEAAGRIVEAERRKFAESRLRELVNSDTNPIPKRARPALVA